MYHNITMRKFKKYNLPSIEFLIFSNSQIELNFLKKENTNFNELLKEITTIIKKQNNNVDLKTLFPFSQWHLKFIDVFEILKNKQWFVSINLSSLKEFHKEIFSDYFYAGLFVPHKFEYHIFEQETISFFYKANWTLKIVAQYVEQLSEINDIEMKTMILICVIYLIRQVMKYKLFFKYNYEISMLLILILLYKIEWLSLFNRLKNKLMKKEYNINIKTLDIFEENQFQIIALMKWFLNLINKL